MTVAVTEMQIADPATARELCGVIHREAVVQQWSNVEETAPVCRTTPADVSMVVHLAVPALDGAVLAPVSQ